MLLLFVGVKIQKESAPSIRHPLRIQ